MKLVQIQSEMFDWLPLRLEYLASKRRLGLHVILILEDKMS